jgi:hypothetical protein
MSNPFDQFDAPTPQTVAPAIQGNPFDQFDMMPTQMQSPLVSAPVQEYDYFNNLVSSHANRLGVDPQLALQNMAQFDQALGWAENRGKLVGKNPVSSAQGLYQITDATIDSALNRLVRDVEPADWMDKLRKDRDVNALTKSQQQALAYANLLHRAGTDPYIKAIMESGDQKAMSDLYYQFHHTAPDDATKRNWIAALAKISQPDEAIANPFDQFDSPAGLSMESPDNVASSSADTGTSLAGDLLGFAKDVGLGTADAALALGGAPIGWMAGAAAKAGLMGIGSTLNALGIYESSPEEIRQTAEKMAEDYVESKFYQPQTEMGKGAVENVGKAIELFLSPSHKLDEVITEGGRPVLGFFTGLAGELLQFGVAHVATVKAKAGYDKVTGEKSITRDNLDIDKPEVQDAIKEKGKELGLDLKTVKEVENQLREFEAVQTIKKDPVEAKLPEYNGLVEALRIEAAKRKGVKKRAYTRAANKVRDAEEPITGDLIAKGEEAKTRLFVEKWLKENSLEAQTKTPKGVTEPPTLEPGTRGGMEQGAPIQAGIEIDLTPQGLIDRINAEVKAATTKTPEGVGVRRSSEVTPRHEELMAVERGQEPVVDPLEAYRDEARAEAQARVQAKLRERRRAKKLEQVKTLDEAYEVLKSHPLYKELDALHKQKIELTTYDPSLSPETAEARFQQYRKNQERIEELNAELFNTPESKKLGELYQKEQKSKDQAMMQKQKEHDLATKDSWDTAPRHGTDIDKLDGILSEGLNPGSALDYTLRSDWSGEYPVQVTVPSALKGERIEHNDYVKSSNRARAARVEIDYRQYTSEGIKQAEAKIQELREKYPDVEFIEKGKIEEGPWKQFEEEPMVEDLKIEEQLLAEDLRAQEIREARASSLLSEFRRLKENAMLKKSTQQPTTVREKRAAKEEVKSLKERTPEEIQLEEAKNYEAILESEGLGLVEAERIEGGYEGNLNYELSDTGTADLFSIMNNERGSIPVDDLRIVVDRLKQLADKANKLDITLEEFLLSAGVDAGTVEGMVKMAKQLPQYQEKLREANPTTENILHPREKIVSQRAVRNANKEIIATHVPITVKDQAMLLSAPRNANFGTHIVTKNPKTGIEEVKIHRNLGQRYMSGTETYIRKMEAAGFIDLYHDWRIARDNSRLEWKKYDEELTGMEKKYTPEELDQIGIASFFNMKGGKQALEAKGITEAPRMTPEMEADFNRLVEIGQKMIDQINYVRVRTGQKAIPKLLDLNGKENYIHLVRSMNALKEMGVTDTSVDIGLSKIDSITKDYNGMLNPSAKKRGTSDIDIELNPFDAVRKYLKYTLEELNVAPIADKAAQLARAKVPIERADGKIKNVKLAKINPGLSEMLSQWGLDITGKDPVHTVMKNKLRYKVENILKNNLPIAVIGGLLRTVLIQPAALLQTSVHTGWGPIVRASARKMGVMPELARGLRASKESRLLEQRTGKYESNLPDRGKSEGLLRRAGQASLKGIGFTDKITAEITWDAAYEYGRDRLGKSGKDLINYADDVVEKTQGYAEKGSKSPVQADPTSSIFFLLQTFAISDFNLIVRDVLGIKNRKVSKWEAAQRLAKYVAGGTALGYGYDKLGISGVFPDPIGEYIQAKEEGKGDVAALGYSAMEFLEKLPGIGGTVKYSSSPMGLYGDFFNLVKEGIDSGKTLMDWDNISGAQRTRHVMTLARAVGYAKGIPFTNQVIKSIRAADKGGNPWEVIIGAYVKEAKRQGMNLTAAEIGDISPELPELPDLPELPSLQ